MAQQFDIPREVIDQVASGVMSPAEYSPFLTPLKNKHVIGTNMAYQLGGLVDVCTFGDNGFFLQNRRKLAEFEGIKVFFNVAMGTMHRNERIKCLHRDSHRYGIGTDPSRIHWNSNTGGASINLAALFGAKRIVLLGFDMKLANGNQHWHNAYKMNGKPREGRKLPFHRHLLCFQTIARDAERLKIEILNASPDSAITEFKKVNVKDLL